MLNPLKPGKRGGDDGAGRPAAPGAAGGAGWGGEPELEPGRAGRAPIGDPGRAHGHAGPAPGRRELILTADDFGWTDGQNQAVRRGAEAGTLTRASLVCDDRDNRAAFAEAVAIARALPRLGVGVHLSLCEGRPLRPGGALPGLVQADGRFHEGLGPLVGQYLMGRLDAGAVEGEWRAQIERALAAGLRPSHLDGHKHVHLLPPLFDLALRLCADYRVPYLRIPGEAPSLGTLARAPAWSILAGLSVRARRRLAQVGPAAGVRSADHFAGFAQSGAMTPARLRALIAAARPGTTEIMLHPAVRTESMRALGARYAWARTYRFEDELAALCDPAVCAALAALN